MCHSVDLYMPQMTRDAAEHRIGQADFTAAERERRAVDAGLGLIGRLKRFAGYATCGDRVSRFGRIAKALKNNKNRFGHFLWLRGREVGSQRAGADAICAVGRGFTPPRAVKWRGGTPPYVTTGKALGVGDREAQPLVAGVRVRA